MMKSPSDPISSKFMRVLTPGISTIQVGMSPLKMYSIATPNASFRPLVLLSWSEPK